MTASGAIVVVPSNDKKRISELGLEDKAGKAKMNKPGIHIKPPK